MHSNRSKHKFRLRLAAAIATGVVSTEMSPASTLLYDDMTGTSLVYTGGSADEFMGNGITLAPGANDITGFDCILLNATGSNLSGAKINIFVWGAVNLGTINSSSPAFSDELAIYTLTIPTNFSTDIITHFRIRQEVQSGWEPLWCFRAVQSASLLTTRKHRWSHLQ